MELIHEFYIIVTNLIFFIFNIYYVGCRQRVCISYLNFTLFEWSRELVHVCFITNNGQHSIQCKYLVLGKDKSYFVKKKPLRFYKKVLWNWYNQNVRVFYWQHICYIWWTCISTDSRRLVPLFVRGKLNTGDSQEKWKEVISIL